ncbi:MULTISPECIES: protein-methionine-sulfoxide reductase heme-binding subunit MsrQ [Methylomonas]|uniref:sulfite oxidase heme-binding subunit YedZ n=1 Tax=Methylomonas TaxID=416 RepID=UPI001231E050|nr:protein-methionine-sulfoxide reductase heme-binding subunit MsrQ [Methylomonas rhizoryzae]
MKTPSLSARRLAWLKIGVFVAALLPLAKLIGGGLTDALGANPIERITHDTGYWTLTFLMLTLSATPLRLLFGWYWPVRLRRMLGLFAFFYASLHFLIYLVLDQFFDWQAIGEDILKRPYISIGFSAFLLLIPLAVTSTDNMLRRLGGKRWQALHTLVYYIALGGVVHFAWLVKKDLSRPLAFAAVFLALLLIRWAHRHLRIRLRLKTAQ